MSELARCESPPRSPLTRCLPVCGGSQSAQPAVRFRGCCGARGEYAAGHVSMGRAGCRLGTSLRARTRPTQARAGPQGAPRPRHEEGLGHPDCRPRHAEFDARRSRRSPGSLPGTWRREAPSTCRTASWSGFTDAVTDAEAAEIVGGLRQGAAMRAKAFRGAFRVLSVPRGRVWQVVSALQSDPRVRYAHPDWIAHALDIPPNDPFYPNQWNLQSPATAGGIRVEGAWAVGRRRRSLGHGSGDRHRHRLRELRRLLPGARPRRNALRAGLGLRLGRRAPERRREPWHPRGGDHRPGHEQHDRRRRHRLQRLADADQGARRERLRDDRRASRTASAGRPTTAPT